MKKITIAVSLENEKHLQLLMSKIKFVENSRVSTGGMMSTPFLLMEFQGLESDYHEKGYIVEKTKSEWSNDTYFTIKKPDGSTFKTLEDFIKIANYKQEFDYNEII